MRQFGQTRIVSIIVGCFVPAVSLPLSAQQLDLGEYHRIGTGAERLLLIPCMSCRWKAWEPFMERNAERYDMIAVTLAGFGGTPVPDTPLNGPTPAWRNAAVRALGDLIDREVTGQITVIGHSFGGEIAVALASARPDLISRVLLLDSWPFSDRQWFKEDSTARVEQANATFDTQIENLRDADAWQRFNAPPSYASAERQVAYHGWFMATPREVMLQYWRENSIMDLNPMLQRLEMPVLDVKAISPSINNSDSAQTDRHETWQRNGRPAKLQTIFLPNTRHFVMEQRPELLDEVVQAFLTGQRMCVAEKRRWSC